MIRRRSRILFATIAMSVGLSVALSGCSSPTASPSAEPTSTAATPTNSPTVTPTADPRVFAMPTQCVDILPASRLASFEAANLVLLGGPGGRYEGDYLLDPTPEELVGGITCIWGFSDSEASSIAISVAPLSLNSRGDVIDNLLASGLNESELDGASIFGKQGDRDTSAAIINAIRPASWISIIATVGGVAPYQQANEIVAEVTAIVYVTP